MGGREIKIVRRSICTCVAGDSMDAFRKYRSDLGSALLDTDLFKLSKSLQSNKVLSKEVTNKFAILDPDQDHLEPKIKVRYLLQHVCERIREDGSAYGRLVRVLSDLGGEMKGLCQSMRKEKMDQEVAGGTDSSGCGDVLFTVEDVSDLAELIVAASHKWEEIGVALGVPEYVREEYRSAGSNPLKLSKLLNAWITGKYKDAKSTTVTSLKTVLSSGLVQLPDVAQCLDAFSSPLDRSPPSKRQCLRGVPLIEYQSYDTEVDEGKSTLLEVQVSCSGCESYQWSKDGEPLLDGADFCGVCSNILYINRASQCTEGKYSCRVRRGSETECSDEISLSVIDRSPPSKRLCLRGVPLIEYQSYDTEVDEGKSTLLGVQVSCSGCESYQWSKDSEPLLDGADFCGVCSNILYINRASQCTEGKYSCRASRGRQTECSDEISLSVIYPPGKKELLEFYSLTDRDVPQDSWPPVGNPTIINLVLIQQKPMSTCNYCTIRGDMDDILESKEVAEYEKVFREYREGALVLVEGRPGSGKTTLVNKLTRDWATGKKVLQGTKLVFLVTLRLLNVSGREKSLLDLLQIFYDEDLSKIIEHSLRKCRGKGACFILDGLDEYPIESKKNLVIDQLLFTKTFLPHSMVIVASRPVATEKLKTMCKTRIEVVGFSKDQIYSYVSTYPFNDCSPCMACKMTQFLDQHPNVLHMCYLPVHAAMICFLFNILEGNLPHRETQIYEKFTIATILKHKARKGEDLQLKSLEDLSGDEKELFHSICKLAFDMLINSQLVISKSDARVSLCPDSVLGLLTVERTSLYYGKEDLFNFSHLTLQEFLAAFYIREAKLENRELVEKVCLKNVWKFYCGLLRFNNNIEFVKSIFISYQEEFLYQVHCAYESQQVELCDYVLNDEVELRHELITSTYFIALGYVIARSTRVVTKLSLGSCSWDSEGMKLFVSFAGVKLQSLECLEVSFISDQEFQSLYLLLVHLPFLQELNFLDLVLGKFNIECLTNQVKLPHLKVLKIELPITPCSHPEESLKQLAFGSKSLERVLYSVYGSDTIIIRGLWRKILLCAFNFQRIEDNHKSWLYLCNLQDSPSLPHERLSHCTEVVLVNCCIGDERAEILANTLNTSVLENLVLDFNRISDSGAIALADCLSKCSEVQEVSIECNSIGDSGATALADTLVHCSNLRRLDLQGNSLGDKGAVAIAKAAKSLPNLDLYLHNVNITEEGIDTVLELRTRTRIRNMEWTSSWNSIKQTDVDTLKNALYCGNLPALNVSSTNIYNIEKLVVDQQCVGNVREVYCDSISEDTVPTLCRIVQHLPTLHHIDCSFDEISSHSAHLLSDCINSCKSFSLTLIGGGFTNLYSGLLDAVKCYTQLRSLQLFRVEISFDNVSLLFGTPESWINLHTLKLRRCSNGSDGAQVLSRMLEHCKKLRSLELSGNSIDDRGAIAIAEALKDHTNLLELRMSHNDITSEGVTALSQVIKCNHLQHIDLSRCESFPVSLVDVMCGDSLHALCLSDNELGVDGMASLSVGLEKCKQLVKLDISCNIIGTRGLVFLEEGLQHCTNLQELDLSDNNISSDGVAHISAIMKYCKYLRHLDIIGNEISVDGAAVLVSGWQYQSMLTLNLIGCFDDPHDSALRDGSPCCSSCDHLLELYSNNDYVTILRIPKLVSSHYCDINKY